MYSTIGQAVLDSAGGDMIATAVPCGVRGMRITLRVIWCVYLHSYYRFHRVVRGVVGAVPKRRSSFRLALVILHTYVVFHGVFGFTIRVLIGVAIGYVITVLLHYR